SSSEKKPEETPDKTPGTASGIVSQNDNAKEALSNLEKAAESAKTEVEEFFDEDDEDSANETEGQNK
ncbi:MAG: hypothetical protein K2K54_12155, partial [Lachnospiraceae bacterium]|nr:hypothetical protein [Lachnospiraceae bacterium]